MPPYIKKALFSLSRAPKCLFLLCLLGFFLFKWQKKREKRNLLPLWAIIEPFFVLFFGKTRNGNPAPVSLLFEDPLGWISLGWEGYSQRPKVFIVFLSSNGASFLQKDMYFHCLNRHTWANVNFSVLAIVKGGCNGRQTRGGMFCVLSLEQMCSQHLKNG